MYNGEVVVEYCLWRGYVYLSVQRGGSSRVLPVERLCTSREGLRTLLPFRPKTYLASAAESERAKQELHTTHYTTALGASHRPVFSHYIHI